MSEYGEELIDRLNPNSSLRDTNNPMNRIIQDTIGELLDNYANTELYEQLSVNTATGGYLDLQGQVYNVYRRGDESDDSYRQRIIYEMVGHLTIDYLQDIFNVDLFSYSHIFDLDGFGLVSDNPYLFNDGIIAIADNDVEESLKRKFLLDNSLFFPNSDGTVDYIVDSNGNELITDYSFIYSLQNLTRFFISLVDLTDIKLHLPNVDNCNRLFENCTGLTDVELYMPNATLCPALLKNCIHLTSVTLYIPKLDKYIDSYLGGMLDFCNNLKYIDLTIPESKVEDIKTYINYLHLSYLETLIINGVEVEL